MMQITFGYDRETAVPIPVSQGSDVWTDAPLSALAAAHRLSAEEIGKIRTTLLLAAAESETGVRVGIFEPITWSFSVLRIVALERELTPREREEYLQRPSVLPARIWMTPKTAFGIGCSSVTVDDAETGRSSVRWLFVPVGVTVLAQLSPLSARAVVLMGAMAEEILQTVRIDGVSDRTAADFEPSELIRRTDPDGRSWQS